MKKIIPIILLLCIIIIIPLIFWNKNDNKEIIQETPIKEEKEDSNKTEENKIPVGLYKYYGKNENRKLIKTFESNWEYHKDISSFEVYYTNIDSISSESQKYLFDYYKDLITINLDNYRIGYNIKFTTKDNEFNKNIISPKDTEEIYSYLEIYLYDDYHRNGEWYSHTTEEEYNEDTILTSIKLTAGLNVEDITSDINLSVFVYDKNDLNNIDKYLKKNYYNIIVKKNNL